MDKSGCGMKKEIGGYFGLELSLRKEFHNHCLRLNSGKNCLHIILQCRRYSKVYIPYYTCDIILKPFQELDIEYSFYHINDNLELATIITLQKNEALLYTNYFGLKQSYVEHLAEQYGSQLIVDNSQAFYAKPLPHIDTFYTCRKFFGVPDGAYLYTDITYQEPLVHSQSYERVSHLIKRIDVSPEFGFDDYHQHENSLAQEPPMIMSIFTQRIMQSIDYKYAAKKRRNNFLLLHKALHTSNQYNVFLEDDAVPMVYPYLSDKKDLYDYLIKNKIYIAHYWPNVLEWAGEHSVESRLAKFLLPIPIDQRYNQLNCKHILNLIRICNNN